LAASKKTNSEWTAKPATSTCTGVSRSNTSAAGTLSSTTALAMSVPIMIARRLRRSATAPANRPNSRYGNASAAATRADHTGEPVSWYTSTGSTT
jgi:hypothetical protein